MKKLLSIVLVILLSVALTACLKDKKPDDIKKGMEELGYIVTVTSSSGEDHIVCVRFGTKDNVTIIKFSTANIAKESMSKYKDVSSALKLTCKRNGKYIYYGTETGMSNFEKTVT